MMWSSIVTLAICHTAVFYAGMDAVAVTDADNAALAALHHMGVSDTHRVEQFIGEACKANIQSIVQVSRRFPDSQVCADSIEVKINNAYLFTLTLPSGEIIRFSNGSGTWDKSDTDKIRASQFTADDVFSRTVKVLGLLGQPVDRDQYSVHLGLPDPKAIKDGMYGTWEITRCYFHDGIPCRGRRFVLSLFPEETSVLIRCIYDNPIVAPEEEPAKSISTAQAIAASELWLANSRPKYMIAPRIDCAGQSELQKVIALPNRCFVLGTKDPDCVGLQAQYCWEVPFSWRQYSDEFRGSLWVSLKTGTVVGGESKTGGECQQ